MTSTSNGALIKTAVQLSHEQVAELGAIARGRQVSLAAVVRDAVREYLAGRRSDDSNRELEAAAAA